MKSTTKKQLEENLVLIYIGGEHSANDILKSQSKAIDAQEKFQIQKRMVILADDLRKSIQEDQIDDFGRILDEGWKLKRSLVSGISNNNIDHIYNKGIEAGALGGKLLGAGGAGFILFYCPKEKQDSFRKCMTDFEEITFGFDNFGSQVIYVGDKFI